MSEFGRQPLKRISVDFDNNGIPDNQQQSRPEYVKPPTDGSSGATPIPLPGAEILAPAIGQDQNRYLQMAQSLMNAGTQQFPGLQGQQFRGNRNSRFGRQGSDLRPLGLNDLAKFARTPQGRVAIQGAIDNVISRSNSGLSADVNPYQQIIQTLRAAMRQITA